MAQWQIESKAGVVYGVYEGETPEEAFAAMVDQAGGAGDYTDGGSTAGSLQDWIIREAPAAFRVVRPSGGIVSEHATLEDAERALRRQQRGAAEQGGYSQDYIEQLHAGGNYYIPLTVSDGE